MIFGSPQTRQRRTQVAVSSTISLTARRMPLRQAINPRLLPQMLAGQNINVIFHKCVAFRFQTNRNGLAALAVNARVALIVDDERQGLLLAEEGAGAGGFGDGLLIVERHALRRLTEPQTIKTFQGVSE